MMGVHLAVNIICKAGAALEPATCWACVEMSYDLQAWRAAGKKRTIETQPLARHPHRKAGASAIEDANSSIAQHHSVAHDAPVGHAAHALPHGGLAGCQLQEGPGNASRAAWRAPYKGDAAVRGARGGWARLDAKAHPQRPQHQASIRPSPSSMQAPHVNDVRRC